MVINRALQIMAITAPPSEAFFIHQVVRTFHKKKVRYVQAISVSGLYLPGFLKTAFSTISNGTNAIKSNGTKP